MFPFGWSDTTPQADEELAHSVSAPQLLGQFHMSCRTLNPVAGPVQPASSRFWSLVPAGEVVSNTGCVGMTGAAVPPEPAAEAPAAEPPKASPAASPDASSAPP